MRILSSWLREYVPGLTVSDRELADDLTLRGIAVEGVFDLGEFGALFEMDITTNRVDAMNHYGIAREAATIYGLELKPLDAELLHQSPRQTPCPSPSKSPNSVAASPRACCAM
jgi:phenylalanyl-tRNA synthetase beta chain